MGTYCQKWISDIYFSTKGLSKDDRIHGDSHQVYWFKASSSYVEESLMCILFNFIFKLLFGSLIIIMLKWCWFLDTQCFYINSSNLR